MITNPNDGKMAAAIQREIEADHDLDVPKRAVIRKRQGFTYPDPDKEFDNLVRVVETKFVEVDAKLMEQGRGGRWEQRHYPTLRKLMESQRVRRKVLDRVSGRDLKEINARLTDIVRKDEEFAGALARGEKKVSKLIEAGQLREASPSFYLGLYADEMSYTGGAARTTFSLQDTVLPTTSSPMSKQQLFMDYLDMHRKSWEAATRNPIGKRIITILPNFVLGRGVVGVGKAKGDQDLWDDFHDRNRLRWRTRQLLRELVTYGEIFLRYFRRPEGLVVRSLDPSTIWDIVTDPDDIENVIFYHQQYTTMYSGPVPGAGVLYPARLIIRQIPGSEIDHHKINATTSEKRGRSELYAVLGWLLRLKEFMNDRVLLNKMRAMFALDVKVTGGQPEVEAANEQFATPPGPGAVLVHNDTVEVEFKNAETGSGDAKTDVEMILKIIALGTGISEQFLGVNSAGTRAQALISTEPDVKSFETFQEIIEDMLQGMWRRVKTGSRTRESAYPIALKPGERMEFVFPALAAEDRSAKLKDIAFAEAMDYFSKERSATMAAKEFQISTYSYEAEQKKIKEERGKDPVIATGLQQLPKVGTDPAAAGQDAFGLGDDLQPPEQGGDKKVTHTGSEMGFSAKSVSGRSASNTQATLNRGEFTRGGEKVKIARNRTSGTPLKASGRPRHVWSEKAREAALIARRNKIAERKRLVEAAATVVAAMPAPQVTVHVPPSPAPAPPTAIKRTVERDDDGLIKTIIEEPVHADDDSK